MIKKLLFFFIAGFFLIGELAAQPAGWSHRQDLRVTNDNAQGATGFHVLVVLNTQQLIQLGQMKADGSDIRFGKDVQGTALLPYFIETGINTPVTKIWVKLDEVPAAGQKKFYMYYGNAAATGETTVSIFNGPYSGTDSVDNGGAGGVGNSQRGFRFAATEDIFVTQFGKREPTGTQRFITLFDYQTQEKVRQIQVSGPAAQYSYGTLAEAMWFPKDKEFVIQVYQAAGDGYYFGQSSQAGEHIRYIDMRYCNSCTENTFPTNSLGGMHYGYPDFLYYTRNNSIPAPLLEFGPFVVATPSTLVHGKLNEVYNQQLTGEEGTAPYTFEIASGTLPDGLTLSPEGLISGTATAAGTFNFTVKTTDAIPASGTTSFTLVIDRADQAIQFTAPADKTYGDAAFDLTAISTASLPVAFAVTSGPATISGNTLTITGAGEVTIEATQAGNTDYSAAAPVSHTFTVNKKALTITADNQSKIYGEANPEFTVTYDGLVNGETAVNGITATSAATAASPAGAHDITVSGTSDNYDISFVKGTLTIGQKEISVSLNAVPAIKKEYDGSAAATLAAENFVFNGVINNDDVLVSGSTAAYDNAAAGVEKTITASGFILSGEAKDNYKLSATSATTTGDISRKPVTLTLNETPAITKTYDGTDIATLLPAHYSLAGVLQGDNVSVKGDASYDNKNAGTDKIITATNLVLDGEAKDNYELETTSINTTGAITPKTISIGLQSTPAVSKTYDGNTQAALAADNYTISGVVGSEEVSFSQPLTGVYADHHAGEQKAVTVTGVQLSGAAAANYILQSSTVSGNIGTILKKDVTVTAEAKTKVYGAADPALTYTVIGLVGNDALSGSLQRAGGANAGEYGINIGTLNGGTDYNIASFISAKLGITPAPLLIKPDDKTKKQAELNPAFTYTYTGLVNGDSPASLVTLPGGTTDASTNSPIGYYTLTASGAGSPNYTITYAPGRLTVIPSGKSNVKVWSSSPDVLQLRIYADKAQRSNIVLYTDRGQRVVLQAQQLSTGITSTTVNLSQLAPGIYVLNVMGESFKDVQMVKIK